MIPPRRAFSLLMFSAVTATAPALAQTAERPNVRVGDQWQFVIYHGTPSQTPNRAWVVGSITAAGIEGTENGEPLLLTHDLNMVESPRTKEWNSQLLRFPMEVGQKWRFTQDYLLKFKEGSRGRSEVAVEVAGFEKVKVVAGEFDAFRLEAKTRFHGTSAFNSQTQGESHVIYWYAPAARAVVKSVVMRHPYLGTPTVELVQARLQP